MDWFMTMRTRSRSILSPSRVDDELHEEIRHHLDMQAEENIRRGMSHAEARRQAILLFGGIEGHKEDSRKARGLDLFGLKASLLDFKLGIRMLRKYPGITLVGGACLTVGIALAALFFDFAKDMLDPTIPLPDANRIVAISYWDLESGRPQPPLLSDLAPWRELRSIEDLIASATTTSWLESEEGRAEVAIGARISPDAFRMLRMPPAMGRPLIPSDEEETQGPVIVLGHRIWQRLFDGDEGVIGSQVRVGETLRTVVGVMPPRFGFPVNQEFWLPLTREELQVAPGEGPPVAIFGRLASHASLSTARVELSSFGARAAEDLPMRYAQLEPRVSTFAGQFVDSGAVWALYGVGLLFALLLVVIGLNVSTLVYARTAARDHEIAIRTALGATRRRVIAQLIVEAVVLSGICAGLGLALAQLALLRGVQFVEGEPQWAPFWWDQALSPSTILYAVGLALVGAAVVGGIPAIRATGSNPQPVLAQASGGRPKMAFGGKWSVLIVLQIAISVTFLPMAVSDGMNALRGVLGETTFPAESFLTASLSREGDSPPVGNPASDPWQSLAGSAEIFDEAKRRIAGESGVAAVTFANRVPGMNHPLQTILVDGGPVAERETTELQERSLSVDADYFETMGASILAGREFGPADRASDGVVVVSSSFVRDALKGQNPLGRLLRYPRRLDGTDRWYEIIGVVGDVPMDQFARHGGDIGIYHPLSGDDGPRRQMFAAFATGDSDEVGQRLRYRMSYIDPGLEVGSITTVRRLWEPEHRADRFMVSSILLLVLVGVSVAMASVHAMMSFAVALRQREIGIRIALGARPITIWRTIFSRPLLQLAGGALIGSLLAFASFRRDLTQTDALIAIPIVVLILFGAGVLACLTPTARVLRIQPTDALKGEG